MCKEKDEVKKQCLQEELKRIRNQLTHTTRTAKKAHYDAYFTKNVNNLKNIWNGIKEIISIKSKNTSTPLCIQNNKGQLVNSPLDIANTFNKHYSGIADNILSNRKYKGPKKFTEFLTNPVSNSLLLQDCDPVEVEAVILSFNLNKKTGPNSIPPSFLRDFREELSKPISDIINISFNTGVYPDRIKLAKVVSIYKKGSKLIVDNYRPISLLSNMNKILEKLLYKRLQSFINKYKVLYKYQFGFREKHSTNIRTLSNTIIECKIKTR